MKPRVFIGSSRESVDIAYSVQENLDSNVEATVWDQGIFSLSSYTLDSLIAEIQRADFGIFIMGADDMIRIRGQEHSITRDNVLLEIGLFVGGLGRDRNFLLIPRGDDSLHLPTDLLGLTLGSYEPKRQDGNLKAALGPACNAIRRKITELGLRKRASEGTAVTLGEQEDHLMVFEKGRPPLAETVQVMQTAKKTVLAIGSSLRTLIGYLEQRPSEEFRDHVLRLLERGVDLRFCMVDPESSAAVAFANDRSDRTLLDQIRLGLQILDTVRNEAATNGFKGQLSARLYPHLPFGYVMLVDPDESTGRILVSHYLPLMKRADTPYLFWTKASNPVLFDRYYVAVQRLLADSRDALTS